MNAQTDAWKCNSSYHGTNFVLSREGFFISYNPCPGGGLSMFQGDEGGDETALVVDGTFYILNGDFRDEYEKAGDDLDACMAVYAKFKAEHQSSWSTDVIEQ